MKPGDLYFLCGVVHDWDDESALTILRNCREAISAAGRLLMLETVVPENDSMHFSKSLDLNMLAISCRRERTLTEFCTLLTATGFRMSRIVATMAPQSKLSGCCETGLNPVSRYPQWFLILRRSGRNNQHPKRSSPMMTA